MRSVPRMSIVAGPCSAESEAQVMACARALVGGVRLSYFRAGVWKPRTRRQGVACAGMYRGRYG